METIWEGTAIQSEAKDGQSMTTSIAGHSAALNFIATRIMHVTGVYCTFYSFTLDAIYFLRKR